MMRIAVLTTRFPPDYGGGARHALQLCRGLAARGIESFVITGHKGRQVVSDQVDGINVTRLPMPSSEGLGVLPAYARRLGLLISRRDQYDLIHAHAVHHHAYAGFLAGRLLGKPAIAKMALLGHDDPASIARRRLGFIQLWALRNASKLVATSEEMERAARDAGWPARRLVRIPNGVDTARLCPVLPDERPSQRAQLGLRSDGFLVTFVGLMARRKGIHTLARAWQKVVSSVPNAQLLLVGPRSRQEHWGISEAYVSEVEQILINDGTADSVCFLGQVAEPERYLQVSDLFVFPSSAEGMPNALLEAMACGLPFVATRLGIIEEMAPPEQHPYLISVEEADALAETIITLARDVQLRRELSSAVRRTVEERYSLDTVTDRYVELYHKLLESR